MSEIVALIQARMGSTRCPGKSMALLAGIPLIEHVVKRVQATITPMDVCVATTDQPDDDVLEAHVLAKTTARVYRGDRDDVLARFYWAAELYPEAKVVVRITADDPFKDPALIDLALTAFLGEWAAPQPMLAPPSYMHLGDITWPLGCDVELFTHDTLIMAQRNARDPYEREHVTPWMRRNLGVWTLKNPYGKGTIRTRWTIDTPEDLAWAQSVYRQLYPINPLFGFKELVEHGFEEHIVD